jgi:ATP-binding cassette subfamily A (ABC1) protein 3
VTTELLPSGTGISIRNLRKTFSAPLFKRSRGRVTAISDLSLDIPSQGIFVLLGSNGAGKSTVNTSCFALDNN